MSIFIEIYLNLVKRSFHILLRNYQADNSYKRQLVYYQYQDLNHNPNG